ncbi:MAG: hypothetical protein ACFB0B_05010 [Thermonemataceae bacterium]
MHYPTKVIIRQEPLFSPETIKYKTCLSKGNVLYGTYAVLGVFRLDARWVGLPKPLGWHQ